VTGLSSDEIRSTFLRYFQERGHLVVPSWSLIPPKGSVLMFTTAGVDQFLPYMLGHVEPPSRRLTSVQKVFRTTNIEEVGDDTHHTCFEMLGNWSIGDYFKEEAIAYAWELVGGPLGLDLSRISVTVHPDDDVSPGVWQRVGVPEGRIIPLVGNWWPEEGALGPCGPDTEMFFDRGAELGCGRASCKPGCECPRFVEIWNLVFMQFNRDIAGNLHRLPTMNVDTGMGLERMACLKQGVGTIYETDGFRPIMDWISRTARVPYGQTARQDRSLRIIADHTRGATFLLADSVRPGNEGRGYVLRRVIRRAVRQGVLLGIQEPFLADLSSIVIQQYGAAYPELSQRADRVRQMLADEERRFTATLQAGVAAFERLAYDLERRGERVVPGNVAFRLYDSQGLPLEVVQELAAERQLEVDVAGFEAEMQRQVATGKAVRLQKGTGAVGEAASADIASLPATEFTGYTEIETESTLLRLFVGDQAVGAAGPGSRVGLILDRTPFYVQSGGQVSDTGELRSNDAVVSVDELEKLPSGVIIHRGALEGSDLHEGDAVLAVVDAARRADIRRNHTATHLLHRALRGQLGEHVEQAGSVVAPEHLTFDFTHGTRLSAEELADVEREINRQVQRNLPITTAIMPLEAARASGAMALFGEKYGDAVRVVSIDGYSKELCGGTHVTATGEIGPLIVIGDSGIGSGVRRIEAVTGLAATDHTRRLTRLIEELAQQLQAPVPELQRRLQATQAELAELRRTLQAAERQHIRAEADRLARDAVAGPGYQIVTAQVQVDQAEALRTLGDLLLDKLNPAIVLLAAPRDDRAQLLAAVSPGIAKNGYDANRLVKELALRSGGGGGGGNPRMASGSTPVPTGVPAALASLRDELSAVSRQPSANDGGPDDSAIR